MQRWGATKSSNAWRLCVLVCAICALALSIGICGPSAWADEASASASSTQTSAQSGTVKAGYFSNGDYMYKNDDGSYGGFDIEYLYTVAGYAGWNIQFVEYSSVSNCLVALKNGDIDLMTSIAKTDERESTYLFSNQTMGQSHISVMTRSDDDRFTPGESAGLANAQVAVLRGSIAVTMYSSWCTKNGLTPHIVEFDNTVERDRALADGTVDAIAAGSTIEGTQVIAQFPSMDLYCVFNANQPAFKTHFDRAVERLNFDDPTFSSDLRLKYFPLSKNATPTFSATEKTFIRNHPVVKVAVLASDHPMSYQGSDGTIDGILPSYYNHIGDVTGLQFECIGFDSIDEEYEALENGEVQMIGAVQNDVFNATDHGTILSSAYLENSLTEVARTNTTIETAAVPACSAPLAEQVVQNEGRTIELVPYANCDESFAALKAGKVDAVICSQTVASWFRNRTRSSDYVVTVFGDTAWTACAGIPATSNGNMLRSILNKTFAVDKGYIKELVTSGTLQDSADLSTFLDRIPFAWIATAAAVSLAMAVVLALALFNILRRRKKEAEFAAMQKEADAREAKLEAEAKANRMRADFFSTISHDMRTPLNGIAGFTDLALDSDDPALMRDYLGKIRTSSSILQDLVSDTLVMSRIESGKQRIDLQPQSAQDILLSICLPNRAAAQQKGVDFVMDTSKADDCIIMADRTKVQKIFLNLLSNAVKFTPAGGTVEIDAETNHAEHGVFETRTVVKDTGTGISEDFIPHLFEPFSQEHIEDAGTAGTGLGLAIVKRLVDAMGGTIDVASTKGEGTTFTVELSFAEASPEDAEAVLRKLHSAKTFGEHVDEGNFSGKRALLCEDNVLNLEIARTMLEQVGMTVAVAANGEEGVHAFEASAPSEFDIVLLDLRMPVKGGIDAARDIRSLDRDDAKSVPILAVSADCLPEDVEACRKAGMDGHLAKPIDRESLIDALTNAFSNGSK